MEHVSTTRLGRAAPWRRAASALLPFLLAGGFSGGAQAAAVASQDAAAPAPSTRPQIIRCARAVPSEEMQQRAEGGTAGMLLFIGPAGTVLDVLLPRPSGFATVDAVAMQAVRSCTFTPATEAGQAVGSWGRMDERFGFPAAADKDLRRRTKRALGDAASGDPQQQYLAARAYEDGIVTGADPVQALALYRAAAEQGNIDAELKMAELCARGKWLPQSEVEALSWYRKAAGQGSAEGRYQLGVHLFDAGGVTGYEAAALQWIVLAAQQGFVPAEVQLAAAYQSGMGIGRDEAAARNWYLRAALQGSAIAQDLLGSLFENGQGVPVDLASAVKWYQMAAHQQYRAAISKLAVMVEQGQGTAQDNTTALALYQRAAEGGDRTSIQRLIDVYGLGELGAQPDAALAELWRLRLSRIPEGMDLQRL